MKEIIVILDNIRSALNVGAIFRTADGAGVKKVYLCGITPDGSHMKVQKTALGAEEYIDYKLEKDISKVIADLKQDGYTIYSVEQTKDSKNYNKIEFPEKVALIFGNELTGVSVEALEKSDQAMDIPMYGKKNSLNVATCVGIILYHLITIG
jgi:23S rRNA (guanosine2251-2'-O)-methyltransferase